MNAKRPIPAETKLPPADPETDRAAPDSGPTHADDVARDPAGAVCRAAVLERLGDIGVTLAEELVPLARAQAGLAQAVTECLRKARPEGIVALGELAVLLHQGNVDFAQMYERICRSVRRCIAMQLYSPPRRSGTIGARHGAAPRPDSAGDTGRNPKGASEPRSEAEDGFSAERAGESGPERLFSDLYDRPEDPTGMADLGLDRPVAELISQICADFGVDGRLWAERLGIGAEMTDAPAAPRDKAGRGHRKDERHPETSTAAAPRLGQSDRPPSALAVAEGPGRCAPDPLAVAEPDRPGGLNRRARRALRKLGRPLPGLANRRHFDGGRGPP